MSTFLVAEAPESYVEEPQSSPARGIVIALAASALIWGVILALIF
ncbi:hypothetical protein [Novosphingobium sp.]|nr:hypothetical protein [Novosphingobium sp.]HKR91673.1 hypothetical protein [Novosphingobium sp.]